MCVRVCVCVELQRELGVNKLIWGQSRTLLPLGDLGRRRPDGSVELRPPPARRTDEMLRAQSAEYDQLRSTRPKAAAALLSQTGQKFCVFYTLPYVVRFSFDAMHAVIHTRRL